MKMQSIDYFRARERAEREAVRNAACEQARWAHEQMADAYARLVELEELKAAGAVPAGKVIAIAEVLRGREDAEYGRRSASLGGARAATALGG